MDTDVPYTLSVTNLHKILDKMQNAGVPENFNRDFLRDLGFAASGDRPFVKVLKYLGFLDSTGRPTSVYREFMDHTKAKKVLGARLVGAFDDLYLSDRNAHNQSTETLKGWFKSKTGAGDAVAQKMAATFKSLASYADFSVVAGHTPTPPPVKADKPEEIVTSKAKPAVMTEAGLGFVYRIEIHLPDTANVETYRAIFRALREELM